MSRGLFFDEFKVGMRFVSARKTISEGDVHLFSELTWDDDPIHSDSAYAAGFLFGEPVAHGLLGLSTAVGLAVRLGILEGTILAFREILDWKFSAPIFFGDSIGVVMEVADTKAVPRMGGGLITLDAEITNQAGRIVQRGKWSVLVKGRDKGESPAD